MKRDENENEELLRDIIRGFAKHPADIDITAKRTGGTDGQRAVETLSLRVNADDQPVVVGGEARQIQAIGTLFKFVGARDNRTIRLLLLEPERGRAGQFEHEPGDYQPQSITWLAERILKRILAKPFTVDIYDAEGTAMLEVEVAKSELELAEGFTPYLKSVFNAVGHSQGRDLHLAVRPMIEIPK